MTDSTEHRTRVLSVRLTPTEWETLAERASVCATPLSKFVRSVALGSIPKARPRKVEREAVYQLSKIGTNLNQLTRAANATRNVRLSDRLDEVLRELLRAIGEIS